MNFSCFLVHVLHQYLGFVQLGNLHLSSPFYLFMVPQTSGLVCPVNSRGNNLETAAVCVLHNLEVFPSAWWATLATQTLQLAVCLTLAEHAKLIQVARHQGVCAPSREEVYSLLFLLFLMITTKIKELPVWTSKAVNWSQDGPAKLGTV